MEPPATIAHLLELLQWELCLVFDIEIVEIGPKHAQLPLSYS